MIKNNKVRNLFLFFSLFFLAHQIHYILIGGTTWDEIAGIVNAGKNLEKAKLVFTDFNNEQLSNWVPSEFYGPLLFIPSLLVSRNSLVQDFLKLILVNVPNVNVNNEVELAYIIRHIFLNFYIIFILFIVVKKLCKLIGEKNAIIFLIVLYLIPSFNGHSMFNFADIPLAMQFLLAAIFFIEGITGKSNKKNILIGLFFGLCLLTRVNSIVFLISLSLFQIFYFYSRKENMIKVIKQNFLIYSVAVAVYFVGTPNNWRDPIGYLKGIYEFQFYPQNNVGTMVNGNFVNALSIPRTYLITNFTYKLPIVIIILFLVSLIFYFFIDKSKNITISFSIFFITYVFTLFYIFKPAAYDGIRHYLFLLPFFALLSSYSLCKVANQFNKKNNLIILFAILYLMYSQNGLEAYKYAYFNELVTEENISIDCDKNVGQAGCGDWATDYWGFGGKELVNLTNNYPPNNLLFCRPNYTYSSFLSIDTPIEFLNGQMAWRDEFNQQRFEQSSFKRFYARNEKPLIQLEEYLDNQEIENLNFYAYVYHRPMDPGCDFQRQLDQNKFNVECKVVDGVKKRLRKYEIWINYFLECNLEKK